MKAEVIAPNDRPDPFQVVVSVSEGPEGITVVLDDMDEFQRRHRLAVPRRLIGDGLRLLWFNLTKRPYGRYERVSDVRERYEHPNH